MKNNIFTNLKNKAKNCNYNFAKNFLWHLIAPAAAIVLGIILLFCVNFNLGLDNKGGTLATVVVSQDLSDSKNYNEVKKEVEDICKEYDISIKVYQKVETSYYGNAITIKFDRIADDVKAQLKADLENAFYDVENTTKDDLNTFVKVDNFEANVPNTVVTSAMLAILIVAVVGFVYIASRHGLCAGFVSLMISILDVLVLAGLVLVTRIEMQLGSVVAFVLISVYSLISTLLFVSRANDNSRLEIYAKTSNQEIANITVKENLVKNTVFAVIVLVFALLIGVVPTSMVRGSSLPVMLGVIVSFYSSLMLVPGLWSMLYIRKAKKVKKQEDVVVEEKISEDEVLNSPEVIVETEAKE